MRCRNGVVRAAGRAPFVTKVNGSPSRVGIVFAALSLAAVVAPLIARVADRTGKHRLIYLISMLAIAAAFLLALDAHTWRWSPLFGVIFGVSTRRRRRSGRHSSSTPTSRTRHERDVETVRRLDQGRMSRSPQLP